MGNSRTTGIKRLINAMINTIKGMRAAWRGEEAFRQEVILSVIMIPAGFFLGRDAVERALLVGSCLFVLTVELLNTAVEATIDRIGDERHPLSAQAKDCGSAAVFCSLSLTVLVWSLVLFDRYVAAR